MKQTFVVFFFLLNTGFLSFAQLTIDTIITQIPTCGLEDGSIDINLSGGMPPYNYNWSNGLPNMSMQSNLIAGTYSVTISDGVSDTILQIDLFDATSLFIDSVRVARNASCAGARDGQAFVFARSGTPNTTLDYRWDNPGMETSFELNLVPAGTYRVTVTDPAGCFLVDSVTITEPDSIMIDSLTTDILCRGDSTGAINIIQVIGGTPSTINGYDYTWTGPNGFTATTQDLSNLVAGTYNLSLIDSLGMRNPNVCTYNYSWTITEPDSAIFTNIVQLDTSCAGQNTSRLRASATGGTPGFNFSWQNGPDQADWNFAPAGTQILEVTDANGCISLDSIDVASFDSIQAELAFTIPNCAGNGDATIAVTQVSGGAGNGMLNDYTYEWNFMNEDSFFIQNIPGGNTYTVTITDVNGCEGVFSRNVPLGEVLSINLDVTELNCAGDSTGFISVASVDNANLPIIRYTWSTGDSLASLNNLGPGTYDVTIEDSAGCTDSASVILDPVDSIFITLSDLNLPLCEEMFSGPVEVEVTGGMPPFTIAWQDGDTNFNRDSLLRGSYGITVTDMNGCTEETSVFITDANTIDSLDLIVDSIICHNTNSGAIEILPRGGTFPFMFSLNGGQSFSTFGFNPELSPGFYDIVVTDADGCTIRDSVLLRNPDSLIIVNNPMDTTMSFGDTLIYIPRITGNQGDYSIEWLNLDSTGVFRSDSFSMVISDSIAILRPIQNNRYGLIVEDSLGCTTEISFLVRVIEKVPEVYVPTAFTPDERENNLMGPLGEEGVFVEEFRIFDRWGELMFELDNFLIDNTLSGWDGDFEGNNCQPGVYTWYAKFIFTDNKMYTSKGHTTLIR